MLVLPEPWQPTLLLWILVGLATLWDVSQRRIPNRLVLAGLLAGLFLSTQLGGLTGLGRSLLGAATAFAIMFPQWALLGSRGGPGGGDVKLMTACGTLLFWDGAVHVILLGMIAHGLLGLAVMLLGSRVPGLNGLAKMGRGLPHAVGYAIATILYTLGIVQLF